MPTRIIDGKDISIDLSEIKRDISSGNTYLTATFQNETKDMVTHLHMGFSEVYLTTMPHVTSTEEFVLAEANAEADRFLNERGKELFDMADYYVYYASEFGREKEKFKPLD